MFARWCHITLFYDAAEKFNPLKLPCSNSLLHHLFKHHAWQTKPERYQHQTSQTIRPNIKPHIWHPPRPKGRRFLLLDAHARAQEYSVRNLHPDHGAYRTPHTAILLFQVLLYLSDYYSVSHSTNKFGWYRLHWLLHNIPLRSRIYTWAWFLVLSNWHLALI